MQLNLTGGGMELQTGSGKHQRIRGAASSAEEEGLE